MKEMNSLHDNLQGLRYYLRVIRRDDFADRIEDCKTIFLEIVDAYHVRIRTCD